jgi:ribonuclease P protein component
MRLPSSLRLKESRHFQRVREKGVSHPGRFLVLATLRDEESPEFLFGLITGKKIGKAVTRNRIRRLLREIIRAHRSEIQPGYHFVTIARWRSPDATLQELEQDWLRLAKRAGLLKKTQRPATSTAPNE